MRLLKSWFAPELNGEIAPLSQHSSWKPINNLPKGPCHRSQHAVCSDGTFIYLHGGRGPYGSLSDLWKFNIDKQIWTLLEVNGDTIRPSFLEGHSLLFFDNNLFMFGGETSLATTDEVPLWKFDMLLNQWIKVKCNECKPVGRREHVAVLYHGSMLVHGGYIDLKGPSDELWNYDFAKNSWSLLKSCSAVSPSARYKHSGVMFKDLLWLSGGLMGVTGRNENQVWIWNMLYNYWSSVKVRGAPLQLFNHTTCLVGDEVYVFGGNQKDGQATSKLWKTKINETNGKYTQVWKLCRFPDKVFPSASCSHCLIVLPTCSSQKDFSSKSTVLDVENRKNLVCNFEKNKRDSVIRSESAKSFLSEKTIVRSTLIDVVNKSNNLTPVEVKQDVRTAFSNLSSNDDLSPVVHKSTFVNQDLLDFDQKLHDSVQGSKENLLQLSNSDDSSSHYTKKSFNYEGYVNSSFEASPKYLGNDVIKRFSYNLSTDKAQSQHNKKKPRYQTTSFIEISSDIFLKRVFDKKSLKVVSSVSNPAVAFVKTNQNEQVLLPAALYENAEALSECDGTSNDSSQQYGIPKKSSQSFQRTLFLIGGSSQMFIPPLKEPLQIWTCKLEVE